MAVSFLDLGVEGIVALLEFPLPSMHRRCSKSSSRFFFRSKIIHLIFHLTAELAAIITSLGMLVSTVTRIDNFLLTPNQLLENVTEDKIRSLPRICGAEQAALPWLR